MPDRNAAAHRVLGVAKALRDGGHEVVFCGISKNPDCSRVLADTLADCHGFESYAIPYPRGTRQWISYITSNPFMDWVNAHRPDMIIAYNYPAVALGRLLSACRSRGILLIGDVTEWYAPEGGWLHKAVKWADTEYRMRRLHSRLDGIIAISGYLARYYRDCNTVTIPPTVDLSDAKWCPEAETEPDATLRFVYAGTPWGGGAKDMLNRAVRLVGGLKRDKHLKILGITRRQYLDQGNPEPPGFVEFMGRVPHAEALRHVRNADFQIFIREINRVTTAGFPTKFVESMACGTPVVTNRSSDLDRYLLEGVNGYWADEKDVTGLLETLDTLTADRRRVMKAACREMDAFDYRKYIAPLLEMIDRALKSSKIIYES